MILNLFGRANVESEGRREGERWMPERRQSE
jgi:hypothetical protein